MGLTSMFAQNTASLRAGPPVKERHPRTVTAIGRRQLRGADGRGGGAATSRRSTTSSRGPPWTASRSWCGTCSAGRPRGASAIRGVFSRRNVDAELRGAGRDRRASCRSTCRCRSTTTPSWTISRELPERQGRADADLRDLARLLVGERAHCTFCGLNGGTMNYRCDAAGAGAGSCSGTCSPTTAAAAALRLRWTTSCPGSI